MKVAPLCGCQTTFRRFAFRLTKRRWFVTEERMTPKTPREPPHRPKPGEYFLEETDSEYLLCIHYTEKSRARGIQRWHWDGNRKCWVYPKNQRSYHALLAEFGDELIGVGPSPTRGKDELPEPDVRTAERNDYLITELANARVELERREIELTQARSANIKLRDTVKQLRKQLEAQRTTQGNVGEAKAEKSDQFAHLVPIAVQATGGNPVFEEVVSAIPMDHRFPIEISGRMTWALRRLVGDDHGTGELFDLLAQAQSR